MGVRAWVGVRNLSSGAPTGSCLGAEVLSGRTNPGASSVRDRDDDTIAEADSKTFGRASRLRQISGVGAQGQGGVDLGAGVDAAAEDGAAGA